MHLPTADESDIIDRIEKIALELDIPCPRPNSMLSASTILRGMEAALECRYERTGQLSIVNLSMQLYGLEGQVVTVQDYTDDDAPRSFLLGTTEGFAPSHIELPGGRPCLPEYHRLLMAGDLDYT